MSNYIVAPYYTTVPCPQRGRKAKLSFDLMRPWCDSLQRLNLAGIIVYDVLPDEIRARFPFGDISLHHGHAPATGLSGNDWRFFVYRDWLASRPDVESVFFTDLFDLVVQHDPHPWMLQHGGMAFGCEASLDQGPWMSAKLDSAFGGWRNCLPGKLPRVTAGLFGGLRNLVLPFLEIVCGIIEAIHVDAPTMNCNMPAVQMAVHAGLRGRNLWFGTPLHDVRWRWGGHNPQAFFHHRWEGLESAAFEKE